MTLGNELADIEWLTGDAAGALLAELAENSGPLHTTAARLRATLSPAQTHLLLEQVDLRRRAAAKFTQPHKMFFTRVGLEQATDEWVATYKAQRFFQQRAGASPPPASPTARTIADLCCGIGGDLLALTRRAGSVSARSTPNTIGIDRDPISAHFAAINANTEVHALDATAFDFDTIDAWHIDPDRRHTGHRTTSLEWCEPNLATIEQLLARVSNAAIKLAPATKPPADWIDRCELEWISRDHECKQQVAWHGNLATSPAQHRATIITTPASRGVPAPDQTPRTITGPPHTHLTLAPTPDRYIFDVDPAVSAARLTGTLAAEHNLAALSPGPTYLTGSQAIDDAALACFEIDDILPLRVRTLANHLRAHNIGQLEIKKRGVEIDPEKLRRDLKLRGANAATLLITTLAEKPTAILAHRLPT